MAKKNIVAHFISFCALCIGFILCRYMFLEMHGMKEWSFYLFAFSFVVIGISFLTQAKCVSIAVSFSYIAGFIVALLFHTEGADVGGGRTDNLWIVWTSILVCAVIFSVLYEIIRKKRERNL